MRLLLLPPGFLLGALAGLMAEIGIVSLIEQSGTGRVELPLLMAALLPAAIGIGGAILLLAIVRRTCGPVPSPLALLNAVATAVVMVLAMIAALAFVANPFDATPPSASTTWLYDVCLLGPIVAMLIAWVAVRRRAA